MRGKAKIVLVCDLDHRITPAYAGKSSSYAGKVTAETDHPRLCGEKSTL